MSSTGRSFAKALGLLVTLLLLPELASACSVCFGGASDSKMAMGVNNGILVLLGCIVAVQVAFAALFWNIRKRARKLDSQRERFSLIEGGAK